MKVGVAARPLCHACRRARRTSSRPSSSRSSRSSRRSRKGQRVGTLRVTLDGKPLGEYPLVALEPVGAGGLLRARVGYTEALDQVTADMVFLNGEFLPLERGQGPGARPRLHLRRRRLRGGAGLFHACRSAWTSTSRGSSAASPRSASAIPTRASSGASIVAGMVERAAVRGPGRLLPGDARRGEARPRVPEGRRADGVHDVESAGDAAGGAGGERRGAPSRAQRLPLAALRHQVDLAHRQRARCASSRPRRARSRRSCSATASSPRLRRPTSSSSRAA